MKRSRAYSALLSAALLPASIAGLIFVGVAMFFVTMPDVSSMRRCMTTSMYHVSLCPGGTGYVRYDDIAPIVIEAVVASEDAAFFSHGGFDWYELRMSLSRNLREQSYRRGGSTITQQLAKNVFLNKEKSLFRKVREAYLTREIERQFSKKEILERYLNVVEFGPGLYGINAASQHYFNKPPRSLNLLEASYLAFLLPNPTGYSKSFASKTLTPFGRRMLTTIIGRLYAFKRISPEAQTAALSQLDQFPWVGLQSISVSTPATLAPTISDEDLQKVINDELSRQATETAPPQESESESETSEE